MKHYFIVLASIICCIMIGCRDKNQPQISTLENTAPVDTGVVVPVTPSDSDTIPTDTTHTIPIDTIDTVQINPLDTMTPDSDGLVHQLIFATYLGDVNGDDDYHYPDVKATIRPSDTIPGTYIVRLYQVMFTDLMGFPSDIEIDGVNADEKGNIYGEMIVPFCYDLFGIEGSNVFMPLFTLNYFKGQTYYNPETKLKYFDVELDIQNAGTYSYNGLSE